MQFQLGPGALHPDAISWSLICDGSQQPFATMSVDAAASRGWQFKVPADCQAQWLQLSGRSADIAQQSDVTISNLRLSKAGNGG